MPVPAKMPNWDLGRSRWYVRYGTAVVFVLLALALQFLPAARQVPFAFFFAAVALSARICGFGAAIFSSLAKKRSEADKIADKRRAQLAAVVESSEDAIFNKTLDGTVLTWNRAAQAMYGYTPKEMIGRNVAALAPPEKAGEIAGILQQLRRGARIAHFETDVRTEKWHGRRSSIRSIRSLCKNAKLQSVCNPFPRLTLLIINLHAIRGPAC